MTMWTAIANLLRASAGARDGRCPSESVFTGTKRSASAPLVVERASTSVRMQPVWSFTRRANGHPLSPD